MSRTEQPHTVAEEKQHRQAQRGSSQQDQADVAGDHEVPNQHGGTRLLPGSVFQWQRRHDTALAHFLGVGFSWSALRPLRSYSPHAGCPGAADGSRYLKV